MRYIAVCKDMFGNVFEMTFNSREERTAFVMQPWTYVLFTFEREECEPYLIKSSVSSCIHTTLNGALRNEN